MEARSSCRVFHELVPIIPWKASTEVERSYHRSTPNMKIFPFGVTSDLVFAAEASVQTRVWVARRSAAPRTTSLVLGTSGQNSPATASGRAPCYKYGFVGVSVCASNAR